MNESKGLTCIFRARCYSTRLFRALVHDKELGLGKGEKMFALKEHYRPVLINRNNESKKVSAIEYKASQKEN